ncbi:hypothetical protein RBA41_21055 [Massilia sp. CCM 9210]|uniref:hypothetical protein n=1 Tax=Massilia scottii TaxID=3057166 RepID=UPI002796B3C5|nr:hypothetical protein [Massilia sp. CCM 9210]MDQ1815788.1 hypothetical protein [Massilia sp. CCM 9210]
MKISDFLAKKALAPLFSGILLLQGCAAVAKDDVLKFSTHNVGLTCYGGVTK